MAKKKPNTPRSRVRAVLRQLCLRSRERAKVLKDAGYRCRHCDVKQSTAKGKEVKIQVHHDPQINWENLLDLIYERLLNVPQYPLCNSCHKKVHERLKDE